MTWFRVDDTFDMHPKVLAAGNSALGLWTRGGAYCSRLLTDGRIPTAVAVAYGSKKDIAALLASGLWIEVEDGYLMRDFLDYNYSAEEVVERRKKRSDAGRMGGIRSGQTRRGEANGQANAEALASGLVEAELNPIPSHPYPSLYPSSSSSTSSEGWSAFDDDDDEFTNSVVEAIVAARMENQPGIRNPKAYIRKAVAEFKLQEIRDLREFIERCNPQADNPEVAHVAWWYDCTNWRGTSRRHA